MSAQQMLFLTVAVLLAAGIGLTGWNQVHWLLYVLGGLMVFAGVTGICPTYMIFKKLGFK